MLIGPFYVAEGDEDDPEKGKQKVCELVFIQAIICTAMCVPVLLGFKERPKHYPSEAAMN